MTGHQGPSGGVEVQLYSFSISALGRGGKANNRNSVCCKVSLHSTGVRVEATQPTARADIYEMRVVKGK
jgi:hypothetical protein